MIVVKYRKLVSLIQIPSHITESCHFCSVPKVTLIGVFVLHLWGLLLNSTHIEAAVTFCRILWIMQNQIQPIMSPFLPPEND